MMRWQNVSKAFITQCCHQGAVDLMGHELLVLNAVEFYVSIAAPRKKPPTMAAKITASDSLLHRKVPRWQTPWRIRPFVPL